MPNFCAAPNCTRKSTQSDLAFFRFPRDPGRCQKWVENCRRYDLEDKTPDQLNKHYRLCAQHFEDSMICRSSPYRTVLRENAVPTIFDLTSHLSNPGRRRKRIKELTEEEIRMLKERKSAEMGFGLQHSFLTAPKSFLDMEGLIALVRLHPELYDPQHPSYDNAVRRGKIWDRISSEIVLDWADLSPQQRSTRAREAQTLWESLKENFRQELRRRPQQGLTPLSPGNPVFSHYKEMLFLRPLMVGDENILESSMGEEDIQVVYIKEEPPSPLTFTQDPDPQHEGTAPGVEGPEDEDQDPHMDFAQSLVPYLAQVPDSHQASLRMELTKLIFCYIENTRGHPPTISPQLRPHVSTRGETSS